MVSRFRTQEGMIVVLCVKPHHMFILALSLLLTHDVWIFFFPPNPAVMSIHNCTDKKGASREKKIEVEYCLQICHATRDPHLQSTKVDSR